MNTNNKTNNAGTIAKTIGGATIASGLATIGTGVGIVAAPAISVPLAIAFGAGCLVSEAWGWLRS